MKARTIPRPEQKPLRCEECDGRIGGLYDEPGFQECFCDEDDNEG